MCYMCTGCADCAGASLPFPPSQGNGLRKEESSCESMSRIRRFVGGVACKTSAASASVVLCPSLWLQEQLYKEYLCQSVGDPFDS